MKQLEEKEVTCPAPTTRRIFRAIRFEYKRVESVDPYRSYGLMEGAINGAEDAVYGMDGRVVLVDLGEVSLE